MSIPSNSTFPSSYSFPVSYSFPGSLDPDTKDFKLKIINRGSGISNNTLQIIDDFVSGCKADLIYDYCLDSSAFVGNDLQACLTKLTQPQGLQNYLTNYNFVEGDYAETLGLLGNGYTKVLDTGFALASQASAGNISTASCGLCVYITEGLPSDLSSQIASDLWLLAQQHYNGSTYYSHSNLHTSNAGHAYYQEQDSVATGFFSFSHLDDTAYYYENGVLVHSETIGGCSNDASSVYVLGRNRRAYPQRCPRRIGFYAIKKGMTAVQELALYNRVHTLQVALGRV